MSTNQKQIDQNSDQTMNNNDSKTKKPKRKVKVDWKMLWPIISILIFGMFTLVGFLGVGFGIKQTGGSLIAGKFEGGLSIKIGQLDNINQVNTAYALSISGIVIAWVTLIIPLVLMWVSPSRKLNQWIGILALFLTVLAGVLMMVGIGFFIGTYKKIPDLENFKVDTGAIAGLFIIIIVGWLIGISGITWGFWGFSFRKLSFSSASKANKQVKKDEKVQAKVDAKATTVEAKTTQPKPIVENKTTAKKSEEAKKAILDSSEETDDKKPKDSETNN